MLMLHITGAQTDMEAADSPVLVEYTVQAREEWNRSSYSINVFRSSIYLAPSAEQSQEKHGFIQTTVVAIDLQSPFLYQIYLASCSSGPLKAFVMAEKTILAPSIIIYADFTSGCTARLLFRQTWERDPFAELPNEIILHIFAELKDEKTLDFHQRGSSTFYRDIQSVRAVCRRFAKIGLLKLCQVLGRFVVQHPGTNYRELQRVKLPIDPLKLFEAYPTVLAPCLQTIDASTGPWAVWMRVFNSSHNVISVKFSLRCPFAKSARDAVWRSLSHLRNLKLLDTTSEKEQGQRRWNSADLSALLSHEFQELLILGFRGWDLSNLSRSTQIKFAAKRLRNLMFNGCLISKDTFTAVFPTIRPQCNISPYFVPVKQNRQLRVRSCFTKLFTPEDLLSSVVAHTEDLHALWVEMRGRYRRVLQADVLVLPRPIDQYINRLRSLRRLVIDGGHEHSGIVSSQILLALNDCPFLWMLNLNWVYVDVDSLLPFLSSRRKYRDLWPTREEITDDPKFRGFNLSLTYFWGDCKWDADDFTVALRQLDVDATASEYMKYWDEGDECDMDFNATWFRVIWNNGGAGPVDTERFWD
ncbi:hypothetical protein BT69DRAFT_1317941 [Atractiella rhizophila]|nr:hypothetical protein BT69DRAFT_1317941 [Atractiella rhizophila]